MSDYLPHPAVVVVLGLIVAVAYVLSVVLRRRRETVWQELARRWGLRYEPREVGPVVGGEVQGRAVRVAVMADTSDRDTLGFEEVRMEAELGAEAPRNLEVVRTGGAVGSVVRMVEDGTVSMHDEDFDREFVVKGLDADSAESYLTPERRQALQGLASDAATADVGISDGRVYWQQRDMVSNLELLQSHLRQLISAADRLDSGRGD